MSLADRVRRLESPRDPARHAAARPRARLEAGAKIEELSDAELDLLIDQPRLGVDVRALRDAELDAMPADADRGR